MNSTAAPVLLDLPAIRKWPAGTFPTLDRVPRTDDQSSREREFALMQAAFGRVGGLMSGSEAAHRIGRTCDQPISKLARWIVDHTIDSLQWRSNIQVPMFQFEPSRMTLREPVAQVIRELSGVLDGWETALWFAEPNSWLAGRSPLEMVIEDPKGVFEAARADRFLAKG